MIKSNPAVDMVWEFCHQIFYLERFELCTTSGSYPFRILQNPWPHRSARSLSDPLVILYYENIKKLVVVVQRSLCAHERLHACGNWRGDFLLVSLTQDLQTVLLILLFSYSLAHQLSISFESTASYFCPVHLTSSVNIVSMSLPIMNMLKWRCAFEELLITEKGYSFRGRRKKE